MQKKCLIALLSKEQVIKSLRVVITDTAKADLSAMYEYIKTDNPTATEALIQDLTDKLFTLAASGITGFSRDTISPGLRAFPSETLFLFSYY